jgi:hypothetical protein
VVVVFGRATPVVVVVGTTALAAGGFAADAVAAAVFVAAGPAVALPIDANVNIGSAGAYGISSTAGEAAVSGATGAPRARAAGALLMRARA